MLTTLSPTLSTRSTPYTGETTVARRRPTSRLLVSLIALALVLAAAPRGGAFSLRNHRQLTHEVLSSILHTVNGRQFGFSPRAMSDIIDENDATDNLTPALLFPHYHFMNETFYASSQRLIDLKRRTVGWVSSQTVLLHSPRSARLALGQALHLIQDFYAHGTYVEFFNGRGSHLTALGRSTLRNVPSAVAACSANPNVVDAGSGGGVSSAFFLDNGCTVPENSVGKCVHGDYFITGRFGCVGINKDLSRSEADLKGVPMSPHHDEAMRLARDATLDYVTQILDALGDDEEAIRALMDVQPDVAFVIDNSTSMGPYLATVKREVLNMADTRAFGSRPPDRMWLSVFNDPDTGTPTVYPDFIGFLDALNGITLTGGGTDCPEPSKAALLRTLDAVAPRSTVYVFTDAASRDTHLDDDISARVEAKQLSVRPFIYPDTCAGAANTSFDRVAEESGGQVFRLNAEEFTAAAPMLSARAGGTQARVMAQRVSLTSASPVTRTFQVDTDARRLLVEAAGQLNALALTSPSGIVYSAGSPNVTSAVISGGRSLPGPIRRAVPTRGRSGRSSAPRACQSSLWRP
jgi:von Willebrand factor A domain-containing protein 7